ncbi:phage holin family protein [Paenisporosarcina sp. TG20]|uniref:phage holin family protein n=1 Tax=Paenisporosarcina sp. TG20 TaxID=1211706 RepID=UPI0012F6BD71
MFTEKLFVFIIGGTWLTFLIGPWHILLKILLIFMASDIVTRVIYSAIERHLK